MLTPVCEAEPNLLAVLVFWRMIEALLLAGMDGRILVVVVVVVVVVCESSQPSSKDVEQRRASKDGPPLKSNRLWVSPPPIRTLSLRPPPSPSVVSCLCSSRTRILTSTSTTATTILFLSTLSFALSAPSLRYFPPIPSPLIHPSARSSIPFAHSHFSSDLRRQVLPPQPALFRSVVLQSIANPSVPLPTIVYR